MRLRADDVACWVLKSSLSPVSIDASWRPGTARSLVRCVRRTYRLGLVAPGRPCLLWISGSDRPGVHALGRTTGAVEEGPDGPALPVRLVLLHEAVPRADLLGDPRMRAAEVLRMPAGSNPSWLSSGQFAAVLDRVADDGLEQWGP